MKVLWVGDAVVSSGFARCTHAACDALHAAGHEVHVLGINHYGDPHGYPYTIYPCHQPLDGGRDGFGVTRLPRLVARTVPDVVVLLNDPWNVPAYLDSLADRLVEDFPMPKLVGWLAVDAKNQRGEPLNKLDHVAVWTPFAANELRNGGYRGALDIVPLGVDHELFAPGDRAAARAAVLPEGIPEDAFIVGAVGRNQPRKRLDLTIAYFAEWARRGQHENAYLYLHVGPTGDMGCDVRSLTAYYGVLGRVLISEPPIGSGIEDEQMASVYSALDVLISTTQGEGWGLTALEAMACGIPCILPRWSAFADWAAEGVITVPCTSTAPSAPLNGLAYTIGGIADREQFIRELENVYVNPAYRSEVALRGQRIAKRFSWSETGKQFVAMLEDLAPEAAMEAAQ